MDSTRPIRALTRGLDALTVLNSRDGATVSEVAQEIRLPRTTVYRILETLCSGGFVFRDGADDRYRLTVRVRGLSRGFLDDAWVTRIAKPFIEELCEDIVWPVSIATVSGSMMMMRETTKHATPIALVHQSAGSRVPLLTSSAGRVHLAFSAPPQRDALLEILSTSADRPELLRMLADVKAQGFASVSRHRRLVEENSLSVPIIAHEHLVAVVSVRFIAAAMPLKTAIERYVPKLRHYAAKIGTAYFEQTAGARTISAPQAAA